MSPTRGAFLLQKKGYNHSRPHRSPRAWERLLRHDTERQVDRFEQGVHRLTESVLASDFHAHAGNYEPRETVFIKQMRICFGGSMSRNISPLKEMLRFKAFRQGNSISTQRTIYPKIFLHTLQVRAWI